MEFHRKIIILQSIKLKTDCKIHVFNCRLILSIKLSNVCPFGETNMKDYKNCLHGRFRNMEVHLGFFLMDTHLSLCFRKSRFEKLKVLVYRLFFKKALSGKIFVDQHENFCQDKPTPNLVKHLLEVLVPSQVKFILEAPSLRTTSLNGIS